ncbi:MAG: hypothetical protein GF392_01115 [Candidatus Omnitrophica bacterium]|nr:hypothetical protein [Candidatus Omnitrophota bacterium]
MDYKGPERRKFKRIKNPLMCGFRIRAHKAGQPQSAYHEVDVRDLGAGGLFFYFDESLHVGELIDIEISFAAAKKPVECVGQIVRIEGIERGGLTLVAAAFVEIDKEERRLLDTVIQKFSGDQK